MTNMVDIGFKEILLLVLGVVCLALLAALPDAIQAIAPYGGAMPYHNLHEKLLLSVVNPVWLDLSVGALIVLAGFGVVFFHELSASSLALILFWSVALFVVVVMNAVSLWVTSGIPI